MENFTHLKDLGFSGALLGIVLFLFLRAGGFLGPMIRVLFETLVSTLRVLQETSARHTDLLASLVDANVWKVNELKEHREILNHIKEELKYGSETGQGEVAENR